MSRNLRGLSARKGLTESLFKEITKAGSYPGADKDLLLSALSEKYLIGKSSVLSASSFYDFLNCDHLGKKVLLCNGTACLTSGKHDKLEKALAVKFGKNKTGTVSCLGNCHSGDSFLIDNTTCSFADIDLPEEIVRHDFKSKEMFTVGTNVPKPVFISEISDLTSYYGILNDYTADVSLALKEIELSSLRGRGGAGFPLHIKLRTSATTVSDKKYVICNADEGDPGAFSDKWLLEKRPHSILFGMFITGLIIGADTGIFYIRGEYPEAVRSVNTAIEEFKKQKLILSIKSGRDLNFTFQVFEGAGAYICGEETSLINSIEGLRPEVRSRPPFPATYGLFGKPTILCNVETFSNLRYILSEGGQEYSSLGTEKSKGTKLVSLDSSFINPGIFEVNMGTPLKNVLYGMGGGTKYPVKAFQIGGPLGGIIPVDAVNGLNLDFESFIDAGFLLGHAGVVAIPEEFPVVKFLLHLFEFTSRESCGKCFPCRIGSMRGFELLKNAVENGSKIERTLFDDLLETMKLGSLCALGGGLALPVMNALHYFSSELEEYFQ
ncbi:MAG: formate dehydrogenase [Bacteroidales bacterium]|nr:formate dehydrogenase [Bacteroidales bacterium]